MGTITNSKILKSADALAVGDKIEGVSKYDGTRAVWIVADVQEKIDPILGKVIQVNAHVRTPDGYVHESHEVFLKASQKIWILA
jgi:hypothetical protein